MPNIESGYILLARKTLESNIMDKPPLYFKLWCWMLLQAKFKDNKNLKKGQFTTSTKAMQEAMSYKIGYRKETPTAKQIRVAYESLAKGQMVGTTKVTGGLLITILKYKEYQNPQNYEGHNEKSTNGKSRAHLIDSKNVKNVKKREIYTRVIDYLNKKANKKYKMNTKATCRFIDARLNEGFKPENFKTVIDIKTSQWLNDPKNNKYLRPETLFGTKFESYLNENVSLKIIHMAKKETPEEMEKEIREALS